MKLYMIFVMNCKLYCTLWYLELKLSKAQYRNAYINNEWSIGFTQ